MVGEERGSRPNNIIFGEKGFWGLNEGVKVQVEWALKPSSLWRETAEVPVVGGEVVEELPMWSDRWQTKPPMREREQVEPPLKRVIEQLKPPMKREEAGETAGEVREQLIPRTHC